MDIRQTLCQELELLHDDMIKLCIEMVKIPSVTPPSNTVAMADYVSEKLKEISGMEIEFHTLEDPVKNVVAILKSGKPGKRLVFSGHLDTYPEGNADNWSESPWSGTIKDGFIYGRGSSDMKAGIACFFSAVKVLSNHKDKWCGDIVLSLAGDEEAMGPRGTKYLLENIPQATGDAMICADVGAPNSLRFGQKGLLWIVLEATGKAAHGAHLHKGENAIMKLVDVMHRIEKGIEAIEVKAPDFMKKIILESADVSEIGAGPGERDILQKTTINFGTIEGGQSPNLVPDYAKTQADIRIPAGVTIAEIKDVIMKIVSEYKGVTFDVTREYEANWSDPNDKIFAVVKKNSEEILKEKVVVTFRVGASDARLYRLIAKIPSINCGLTPYGLGGPDEHVSIEEMKKISAIHLLSAFDYLQAE